MMNPAHHQARPEDVARFVEWAVHHAAQERPLEEFRNLARTVGAWYRLSQAQREAVLALAFRDWHPGM